MPLTRRDLLMWGIMGAGATLLPGGRRLAWADALPPSPRTTPFIVELTRAPDGGLPPIASGEAGADIPPVPGGFPTQADPADCVNVDGSQAFHVHGPRVVPNNTEFFLIHEQPVPHSFHPDLPLERRGGLNVLWGYHGQIPGPTFVARSGTPQLIRFVNDLPANDPVRIGEPITAIHRHGGFQAPEDDGYPLDTFCTGQSRDYFYPNVPAAGDPQNEHATNWYHDHAIDITAENVYRGLAGFFLSRNARDTGDEATGLRLPSNTFAGKPIGPFDLPLVVQDRQFDRNGFLVYNSFDHDGFIGDTFLVNGKIQPFLRVARRKYRFRVLNGSNARVYQFFLSSGRPFVAIGTDSTLLEHPVTVPSFRIAPAERVEVIIDFTNTAPRDEIFLVNRLVQTDGRKPEGLVSPGTPILKFVVDPHLDATDHSQVPDPLLPVTEGPRQQLPRVKVQRTFEFERSDGAWVINGQFFDENRINAKPRRGEPEIWILKSGGGWVHPVHIHLSDFFILSRDGQPPPLLERGRKDTVLIGGEVGAEVRILITFEQFLGRYVFHCHNIEHEDMRMMAQFEVQP